MLRQRLSILCWQHVRRILMKKYDFFSLLLLPSVIKQILATRIHSESSGNNILSVSGISKYEKIPLRLYFIQRVGLWAEERQNSLIGFYLNTFLHTPAIAHYDSCGLMPGSNRRFVVHRRSALVVCEKKTAAAAAPPCTNGNYICGHAVNFQTVLH